MEMVSGIQQRAPRAPSVFASSLRRREALEGFLYISPWMIGFVFFWAGPLLASLLLSFTDYSLTRAPSFVGVTNFVSILTEDRLFWQAVRVTLTYAAINVPLGVIASLMMALLLNQKLIGTNIYRSLLFIPSLVPDVASALIWIWLFNPQLGVINYLLGFAGVEGPTWLASTRWVIPSILIIAFWTSTGGQYMITFLAGLQNIPQELYEVADLDGAGAWQKFRHVTIPMLSPVILFNVIMKVIGTLATFSIVFVATQGGPSYASWFYSLHVYQNAFSFFQMGYACALAWIFLLVVLTFTYLQVKWSQERVYYGGEVR